MAEQLKNYLILQWKAGKNSCQQCLIQPKKYRTLTAVRAEIQQFCKNVSAF
jgi:hypothetical protein